MGDEGPGCIDPAPLPDLLIAGVERLPRPQPAGQRQVRRGEAGSQRRQRAIAPQGAGRQHEQPLGMDGKRYTGRHPAPERPSTPGEIDRRELGRDEEKIGGERDDRRRRIEGEKNASSAAAQRASAAPHKSPANR